MALCGRINACLTLLQPTLLDPIPPHLIERFTVDTLPDTFPRFEPGPGLLCEYCLTLTQILAGRALLLQMMKTLSGLLCELVWYFVAEMTAPRWMRTADGVKPIEEVNK